MSRNSMERRRSEALSNNTTHGSTDRRAFLGTAGTVGLAATAGCLGDIGGGGTTTINILTWEEYGNKKIKNRIEDDLDVKLDITSSTSSSKMFTGWKSGKYKQFDIAIPNNNYVPKMMAAKVGGGDQMVEPVQKDVVGHYGDIYDVFKTFAQNQFTQGGELYGVPIRFGWYGYSYDSRKIPEDHDQSYEILFSGQFQGVDLRNKIIMYDNHFKAMSAAALFLGYRDAFDGPKVTLSEQQIDEIKRKMIDQKPLLQGYIASDPTYIKSFNQGNFLVGQSGRNEIVEMWSNGTDWPKMATPKEGSLAWFESAVVSTASDNKETAWKVINEYIAPKNGAALAEVGFSPSANPKTQQHLSDEQNEMFGAIEPSRLDEMIPFKAVENEGAWKSAWEEIKGA